MAAQMELISIWTWATTEAKIIIILLIVLSITAWSVMAAKALQMRRAKKLNAFFSAEYRRQPNVLAVYDRNLPVEGCPLYSVYLEGCSALEARLRQPDGQGRKTFVSLKAMEHVKRALEGAVASQSLQLESGLITLALAVSGAPFLGLLGTVWGVMSTFSHVALKGEATLATMAPGVAAALITTVAGLLVAIPSMFGYNYLVHNLRAMTVQLDNFAQDLASRMEAEYLEEK
ncbi:MotA/TolQ/ExbB proton channel family protein [Fontisphaera persica]|uniref:MotA/TolQ/ExbB proton channel family protein n=1 Tax=Fontisphaera persica TaxID=2974023 RepID=UPI0024BF1E4A|nr:MotA/TolQ/ExbB proton channel family protein [Fontisphaera persica]WCJ59063.1 MotA/TolQ/ExbB proton channel family protein [Fontisphaera persica]